MFAKHPFADTQGVFKTEIQTSQWPSFNYIYLPIFYLSHQLIHLSLPSHVSLSLPLFQYLCLSPPLSLSLNLYLPLLLSLSLFYFILPSSCSALDNDIINHSICHFWSGGGRGTWWRTGRERENGGCLHWKFNIASYIHLVDGITWAPFVHGASNFSFHITLHDGEIILHNNKCSYTMAARYTNLI